MRFFLLMALYGLVAVVLETTVLSALPAQMLHFDFFIPAVAALAFYKERRHAVPLIILYGIMTDVSSNAPFGMSILSYLIVYSFMRAIIAKISFQEGIALLFWIAMMSLIDKMVCAVVMLVSAGHTAMSRIIIERALAQALFDAVIGLVMVPLIARYWDMTWEKIRTPKGMQWRKMPK